MEIYKDNSTYAAYDETTRTYTLHAFYRRLVYSSVMPPEHVVVTTDWLLVPVDKSTFKTCISVFFDHTFVYAIDVMKPEDEPDNVFYSKLDVCVDSLVKVVAAMRTDFYERRKVTL